MLTGRFFPFQRRCLIIMVRKIFEPHQLAAINLKSTVTGE
jgi:hypothetical protein